MFSDVSKEMPMTRIHNADYAETRSRFRTRPTMVRLFAAVGECRSDASGNVISADVRFYDFDEASPIASWIKWEVGRTLHWHPFSLTLNQTVRAGLHITAQSSDGEAVRYLSNFKIRDKGIFVLNPSNAVSLAEPIETAADGDVEGRVVDDVLRLQYHVSGGLRAMLSSPLPRGALKDPSIFFLTH
jgi:hypothetical protein